MTATSERSGPRARVKAATVAIAVLVAALVATNAWWAYQVLDAGVTATYREASFQDHRQALVNCLAVLPVAARSESTPADVISAGQAATGASLTFEKEGFVWVGGLGFKFGAGGRLVAVKPGWEPF